MYNNGTLNVKDGPQLFIKKFSFFKSRHLLESKFVKWSKLCLKGERIISSLYVRIPKCEVPILAEKKKKKDTEIIDENINIHDGGSNSFRRFHVGLTFSGNLLNQY